MKQHHVMCICNVEQRGQYESQAAHWVVAYVQSIMLQTDLYDALIMAKRNLSKSSFHCIMVGTEI